MEVGEWLTRWTVRLAMLLFVASLAIRRGTPRWGRIAWTVGCGFYLLHVGAAFAYYHHWSQEEAYAFTACQTAAVVGLDWGGGLYVNYLFTIVWLADVCWWWTDLPRPRWLDWAIIAFMGFIAFNATVVFATGFSRWFGIAACGLLIGVVLGRGR
ncbi:MAG TPA: hypothetical protein VFE62_05415 [Gemmataceae bacterium]|nr:hypothetical protein [Gemmataceae bacterium]